MKNNVIVLFFFFLFSNSITAQYYQDSTAWKFHTHVMDSCLREMKTDLEKTNFLRKYTCSLIITGSYSNYACDNYHLVQNIKRFDLPRYFDIFWKDTGSAKCGLTSYIFSSVLNYYGFESYIYNMGGMGTKCTHQTTLVYINDGQKRKLICEDAFYNFLILDSLDKPKDFFELLTELKTGNTDAYLNSDTVLAKMFVPVNAFDTTMLTQEAKKNLLSILQIDKAVQHQNSLLVPYKKSFETTISLDPSKKFDQECIGGIEQKGYPRNFLYLFLFQLGDLFSANEVSYLQLKIEKILKR